jgi:hypothetical protein
MSEFLFSLVEGIGKYICTPSQKQKTKIFTLLLQIIYPKANERLEKIFWKVRSIVQLEGVSVSY